MNKLINKSNTFFLINVVFLIIFLEIFLQFFYKFTSGDYLLNRANLPIYETDKDCCWKLKKNLNIEHKTSEFDYKILTNNLSHHVKDLSKKNFSKSNGKTVLFLGPSFGFGWGVNYEKSYSYLIGKLYENKGFKNIINVSVPGHLPSQQLCWFLKNGYKLEPDVIVHTLTNKPQLYIPENIDLEKTSFCENLCNPNIIVDEGILTSKKNSIFSNPKWVLKNSAAIFYSWFFISKIQSYFISENKITKSAVGLEFQNLDNYSHKSFEKIYKNYLNLVKKKSENTKVIFLYIPDSYNVHLKDRARWSHQNIDFENSLNGYKQNINMLNKKFNFIDTYPELIKESKNQRLYYYIDTHFNEAGNKITFEIFKNYCNSNDCY